MMTSNQNGTGPAQGDQMRTDPTTIATTILLSDDFNPTQAQIRLMASSIHAAHDALTTIAGIKLDADGQWVLNQLFVALEHPHEYWSENGLISQSNRALKGVDHDAL